MLILSKGILKKCLWASLIGPTPGQIAVRRTSHGVRCRIHISDLRIIYHQIAQNNDAYTRNGFVLSYTSMKLEEERGKEHGRCWF